MTLIATRPIEPIAEAPSPVPRTAEPLSPRQRLAGSAVLAAPVLVLSLVPAWQFRDWGWIALLFAGPVVLWGGWPMHRAALVALRRGTATADTLICLGTLAALGWSLYALLFDDRTGPGPGGIHLGAAAAVTVFVLTARHLVATRIGQADPTARCAPQRTADGVARVLAPLVIGLVTIGAGFWLGAGAPPAHVAGIAIAALLIAAPGAFALAVPTALLAGTRRGTQLGILITGPDVPEAARSIDAVVLNRTGPLVAGHPAVVGVHAADGVDQKMVLRLAGAVEQRSAHPLGLAITATAITACGELPGVADFAETPGEGVRGVVAELENTSVIAHAVLVGRAAMLARLDIELSAELMEARALVEATGHTAVAVAWDGIARAVIAIADPVRPSSGEAVRGLRALGIEPIVLTGDDGTAAAAQAAAVGIAPGSVRGETRDGDRVALLCALRREGRLVALVECDAAPGSDTAALATARLGIVSGPVQAGSTASGAAGLIVDRPDLVAVTDALRLALRIRTVIGCNLGWAFGYHAVAIPLAVAGLISPFAAVLASIAGTLFAWANSLRLSRFTPHRAPGAEEVPPVFELGVSTPEADEASDPAEEIPADEPESSAPESSAPESSAPESSAEEPESDEPGSGENGSRHARASFAATCPE